MFLSLSRGAGFLDFEVVRGNRSYKTDASYAMLPVIVLASRWIYLRNGAWAISAFYGDPATHGSLSRRRKCCAQLKGQTINNSIFIRLSYFRIRRNNNAQQRIFKIV